MEVQEEAMLSKDNTQIIKGKRTKRPRQASPLALTMSSTSSSIAEGGSSGGGGGSVSDNSGGAATSHTNSGEFTDTTVEEEHDMANCLILLAQGQNTKSPEPVVAPTTTRSKATGLDLYECKTCNRCFSSFQALGGHRASHKKPKAMGEENKKPLMEFMKESDQDRAHDYESTALSLQIPNRVMPTTQNKSRVHECSVCGAEFSSGQALGGHMRRHRTMNSPAESPEVKKPRAVLSLDLNLPAPEDDHRESKFPFGSKEQVIVFSANSLVDCHN
ncbi:unnamed protein product [Camellia sinensis]